MIVIATITDDLDFYPKRAPIADHGARLHLGPADRSVLVSSATRATNLS